MKRATVGFFGTIIACFSGIFLLAFVFEVLGRIPTRLSTNRARKYVYSIAGYNLSESVTLIYAKRYWAQDQDPMTVCSIFKLSHRELIQLKRSNLFTYRSKDLNSTIPVKKGCYTFRTHETGVFTKHTQSGDLQRGYSLHINEASKLAMFELYVYD